MPRQYLPGLELVKLLALVCMFVDHVDLVVFDRATTWSYEIGRFALPAFFGAFAVGLARSTDPARSALALLLPAVVAQGAWHLAQPAWSVLNVLFVAAYLAATVDLLRQSRVLGLALAFAGFAVFPILEGGWVPLVVFWAGYAAASLKRPVLVAIAAGPLLAVTPGLAALLGLAAPHAAAWLPGPSSRFPLAWVYASHLAVLAALASVLA